MYLKIWEEFKPYKDRVEWQ